MPIRTGRHVTHPVTPRRTTGPAKPVTTRPTPAKPWQPVSGPATVKPAPINEAQLRAKIVELAAAEVGTLEGTDANGTPNNTGAILKYGAAFGRNTPQPWCANFASYVVTRAGGTLNNSLVANIVAELKTRGGWKTSAPKAGDLIVFDMVGNGKPNHIGVIESVDDDGTIHTIEGNNVSGSNEGVFRSEYAGDESVILGFGTPY